MGKYIQGINVCYDYSELIAELEADLKEGLISINSIIGIDRNRKRDLGDGTFPIVNYYYEAKLGQEPKRVKRVLEEMNEWNSIF